MMDMEEYFSGDDDDELQQAIRESLAGPPQDFDRAQRESLAGPPQDLDRAQEALLASCADAKNARARAMVEAQKIRWALQKREEKRNLRSAIAASLEDMEAGAARAAGDAAPNIRAGRGEGGAACRGEESVAPPMDICPICQTATMVDHQFLLKCCGGKNWVCRSCVKRWSIQTSGDVESNLPWKCPFCRNSNQKVWFCEACEFTYDNLKEVVTYDDNIVLCNTCYQRKVDRIKP